MILSLVRISRKGSNPQSNIYSLAIYIILLAHLYYITCPFILYYLPIYIILKWQVIYNAWRGD